MKAWTIAAAALSIAALSACSSTQEEKAAAPAAASVEDQWKSHIKKDYPQWQAPASEAAAPAAAQAPAASAAPMAPADNGVYAEPPGFVVKDSYGTYVPKPEPVQQGDGYSHYTVKKGDNLWNISKLIYRKGEKWQRIYDLNKDVIKDPARLKPGTDLKIPPP